MSKKQVAHICKSTIGFFAFDSKGRLIYYELFSPNAENAFKKLTGNFSQSFLKSLSGYEIKQDKIALKFMRENFRDYAISLGFAKTNSDLNRFLSELGILLTNANASISITKDKLIIQASNTLDELTKQINVFSEHLTEWFGLHYPELKADNEKYAKIVSEYGARENIPKFRKSTGIKFDKCDEEIVKKYAYFICQAIAMRKQIEDYIKNSMKEICPNISSLVDPLLGARLLSKAGSLQNLAKLSSSTIQILGAEKALFRHLRNKKHIKSPKYGLIFMSKYIQNSPKHIRGKIARLVSSKLMMAARIDFYSNRFEPKLKEELERAMRKMRK
ncbi:MAG: NOP58 family protein [Candidatus Aenigmarchaeota archaeon]|nr:NOP58 family protein [Candidatus Aenigmarchaeota archaeon]